MKVKATLKNLRIAPRKTKLVVDLVKGLETKDALNQLDVTIKRSCNPIKTLLESAIANAENNFGLDKNNLYISDARAEAGPTLKRWMPKAFGRAGKILKRTSNITIVLEEVIEGKGRKTKEQMEKDKKAKIATKKKEEKETAKKEKEVTKETATAEKESGKGKKTAVTKTWGSKIFRRKSM
jgi:large subunit ribosomal protein L22